MANEPRQEIGGGTLAGNERILGNSERIKGDRGRALREMGVSDGGDIAEEDTKEEVGQD